MTEKHSKPSRFCYRAVEFRAAEGAPDDGRTLEGYAAVFDDPTEINSWEGTFNEVIARGAFKRSINARTPVMQFDHGRDPRTGTVPIASIKTLREDAQGLFVSARLFDNPVVEPIRQAIEGHALDGMSFRFRVVRETWTDRHGMPVLDSDVGRLLWEPSDRGPLTRTIQELECSELGPVVFPAYEGTTVGVRSMLANLDEAERAALLRDLVGMTAAEAAGQSEALVATTDALTEAVRAEPTSDADPAPAPSTTDTPEPPPEPATRTSDTPEPATTGTSAPPIERNTPMSDNLSTEERRSRQSEIRTRLTEIDNEYAGATLPTDVDSEWTELRSEYDGHESAIQAQETRRASLAEIAERIEGERASGTGFVAGRGAPAVHRERDIYDLAAMRQDARSPEHRAEIYRDNAMRVIERSTCPGSEDRQKAQTTLERTLATCDNADGELARRFIATSSPTYRRAFGKVSTQLTDRFLSNEERTALAVGAGGTGGFAVPVDLDPTILLTSNGAINPLRSISRVERIVGKEWDGVTSAGVTVSRAAEGAEASDNSPTLAAPTVKANRVQGFIPFSREIDQDWSSLQSEMLRLLADAKDVEESNSFVLGDGTGVNAGGVVTTAATGSAVTVSTAAGGFKVPDTLDAITNALPPRFRARATWLANMSVYNKIGALAVAAGYVTDPYISLTDGKPNRLQGYSRYEASDMTTDVSTANSRYLLFGDFQQFLIVDQLGMTVDLIPHLFGGSQRPTGQRGLYAMWRNNSVVLIPGAFRYAKAVA